MHIFGQPKQLAKKAPHSHHHSNWGTKFCKWSDPSFLYTKYEAANRVHLLLNRMILLSQDTIVMINQSPAGCDHACTPLGNMAMVTDSAKLCCHMCTVDPNVIHTIYTCAPKVVWQYLPSAQILLSPTQNLGAHAWL